MQPRRRTRILFICLGNSCRSPMAEAIAEHIASDILDVSSAGLAPLGRVQSMTKITLEKNGYPAKGLESKPVELGEFRDADIVVNMSGQPGFAVFGDISKVEDWAVEDPYRGDAEAYQRVFMDIESRVVELVARVRGIGSAEFRAGNLEGEERGPW